MLVLQNWYLFAINFEKKLLVLNSVRTDFCKLRLTNTQREEILGSTSLKLAALPSFSSQISTPSSWPRDLTRVFYLLSFHNPYLPSKDVISNY